MTDGFFGALGDTLTALDGRELREKLAAIDISVPRQRAGRKTEDRERYCVVHYLRTLEAHGLLDFPLRVEKGESPDFGVTAGSDTFGLELVEVISEDFARARTELERAPDLAVLEGTSVRLPGISLRGSMSFGDQPERLWTAEMVNAVAKKTAKLDSYRSFPTHRLLAYDNSEWRISTAWTVTELPARLSAAIQEFYEKESRGRRFEQISVLRDRVLMHDVSRHGFLLPVPTGKDLPPILPLDRIAISEERLREFCREHQIRKLGFFGSVRGDKFGPHSDVDVLVEFDPDASISLFDMAGMEQDLTQLIERKVDLRTVPELSQYFREEVFRQQLDLAYVAS